MTTGGWIIMLISVGGVVALLTWCVYKGITTPGEASKLHGFEAETPDETAEKRS